MDELIAAAELGEEARKFLQSDLYRCITGMAEQEVRKAQEALAEVDPEDAKAVRALQQQIKLFQTFESWLIELVSEGNNALTTYIHERNNASQ